jgi:TP901 family phage tail tape measure protein
VAADLKVTLDGEAAKLIREVERTQRSMLGLEMQLRRTDSAAAELDKMIDDRRAKNLESMGRGMVAFGAATLAGLGLATKAAIDWESAWAGVRKTVEGTPEQLAELESELRQLATTLPATHREIAAVAEAAGQLGVQRQNVAAFTQVMIMLGETTDLSAGEAATAIAQLMNVMRTAPQNVGRLGAALVELGNNGASTEREIIQLAQRIAGAGRVIGLSEAEVLGFASAIASVGIDAEAGGSAISRVMINISQAVAGGGDAVEEFAKVAGISSAEFVTAFRDDPAQAINSFVQGLGRISDSGGNVFAVLEQVGLGEIRVRDALLRLAGAGDLLSNSLDTGTRAWEENTALVEEAEKRFDTTAAKISIARNTLVDFAIDIGGVLLPAVAKLGEVGADFVGWISDLPAPIRTAATMLALVAGAASLVGGALLLLAPRILAAKALFLEFAAAHRVAAGAMITAGQVASLAAGLLALVAAAELVYRATLDSATGVGEMTDALLKLRSGEVTGTIDGLIEKFERLGGGDFWQQLKTNVFTIGGVRKAADELAAELESVDKALASLVQGGEAEAAEEAFAALASRWEDAGGSVEDLRSKLPDYRDALKAVSAEQQLAAETADPLQDSLAALGAQFGLTGDDAAKAAQEMLDAWSSAAGEFISFTGAYDTALAAKEESERATAEATAEATGAASDSWEDFVGDVAVTVDEYLAELERQVQAQEEWSANLLGIAGRIPNEMLDHFARLGPEGAAEVALMNQMTTAELERAVAAWRAKTGEGVTGIQQRLAEAAPVLAQIAQRHGATVSQRIAAGMAANSTSVFQEAARQGVLIDRGVGTNRTRRAPIAVDVTGIGAAERNLNNLARTRYALIQAQVAVTGRHTGITIHSGGEITDYGVRRYHAGGLAGDERAAVLQVGERVLSVDQNRAFTQFMKAIHRMPSYPVGAASAAGSPVIAHIQVSPWDARVPGLRQMMEQTARQVVADLRVEIGMSAARGGPA